MFVYVTGRAPDYTTEAEDYRDISEPVRVPLGVFYNDVQL